MKQLRTAIIERELGKTWTRIRQAAIQSTAPSANLMDLLNELAQIERFKIIEVALAPEKDGNVLGQTDGKNISLHPQILQDALFTCFVFFHALGHMRLHYTKTGRRVPVSNKQREEEANLFSLNICCNMFTVPDQQKRLLDIANRTVGIRVNFTISQKPNTQIQNPLSQLQIQL
jgi:hypothetical protein